MSDPQNPAEPVKPASSPTPPESAPAYTPPAAETEPPAYTPPAPESAPAYTPPAAESAAPSAPAYSAPAYSAPPAPAYAAGPGAPVPGKTMGIVALVLAIVPVGLQLVGLILGIVALVQSRKAGVKNAPALWAIIVSSVLIVIGVIVGIVLVALFAGAAGDLASQIDACLANGGTGYVEIWGQQVSCEQILDDAGY
ncbi:DUF4190 domain-containing protein [Microbacterium sp. W1N]|uniref:DUF4190 domain-containing protein n=1 Tax=Microbacterium festucae TaxID=2977531 RepID=UPI0021C01D10|nr:DUF4190 domain-containing protein [Microbacterium festucae]MCT9821540.1 DUF4190 domain-containing protein [Microbacterium festucae]